jgi:dihydroflavonol-4-reductase
VARQLADAGADLRLLVRKTSRLDNIEGLPGDRVTGDLCDPATLKKCCCRCEVVVHVAADYRYWTPDPQQMYRSNVDGTRVLIESALRAGVRRVVYTSSVATMGFRCDGALVDEDSPVSLNDMIGHYKRSKFLAEQVALEAGASGENVIVVNPTTPVGEHDIKPTPTGQIILDFLRGKMPAYIDTGLNLVDVRECARGHVAAIEKGRAGERYILGGENLTLKQIFDKLSALTGKPAPTIRMPYAVAFAYGAADTFFTGVVCRREPRVVLDTVRIGRKKMFVSSAKAERELGWKVVPVDDALRRAVEWFRECHYA